MEEFVQLLIGVLILVIGIPIGNFLAKITEEELKQGKFWFGLIVLVSLIVGFVGLFLGNDFLMFGCFFIALVTSRSLKK